MSITSINTIILTKSRAFLAVNSKLHRKFALAKTKQHVSSL